MRCARCGRRGRRLRSRRGPDGRLVFGWCPECLAEVHLRALGLHPASEEPRPESAPTPTVEPHALPGPFDLPPAARDERAAGLRGLGALLVTWGLLLELVGAGSWLGFGRPDDGFGPTRISRVQIFSMAGAMLAVAGAWIGLASLGRGERRRTIARAIEAAAVGLGLCILVVGIVFHDPRRDPWVVAGVLLAAIAARAARSYAGNRGHRPRPITSG